MKILIAALALTVSAAAFAEPCCIKTPNSSSGFCLLKSPQPNGQCAGGFTATNVKECPKGGAEKSFQCSSSAPTGATVMYTALAMDKTWYFLRTP